MTMSMTLAAPVAEDELGAWIAYGLGVPAQFVTVTKSGLRRLLQATPTSYVITIALPFKSAESIQVRLSVSSQR